MTTKNEKRRIILTKEQEEKMAAQSAERVQAFANELGQVQSRRLELTTLIIQAEVTKNGAASMTPEVVAKCSEVARATIEGDSLQKWTDIKALFAELGVHGPQAHLEWAAKRVGVTLFETDDTLIQPATVKGLIETVSH